MNALDVNERFFSIFWNSFTDENGITTVDVNFNVKVDFHSIGLDGDIRNTFGSQGCPGAIAFDGTSRSDLIIRDSKSS